MRWLLIFWLLYLLYGCSSKKKTVDISKSEVTRETALQVEQTKKTFITEYFGGQLNGRFSTADSTEADSAEFESDGLKVKIKVASNGKGGKNIDFKAEAKPVARSTLSEEKTSIDLKEKQASKEVFKQTTKEKTSPGGWVWLVAIFLFALLVWLIRRALKF